MSALRIFRRRPGNAGEFKRLLLLLGSAREQARTDAITIAAQGRAIRELKAKNAELRAQLAVAGALDVRGER